MVPSTAVFTYCKDGQDSLRSPIKVQFSVILSLQTNFFNQNGHILQLRIVLQLLYVTKQWESRLAVRGALDALLPPAI